MPSPLAIRSVDAAQKVFDGSARRDVFAMSLGTLSSTSPCTLLSQGPHTASGLHRLTT